MKYDVVFEMWIVIANIGFTKAFQAIAYTNTTNWIMAVKCVMSEVA